MVRTIVSPDQLPMFLPESDWRPPASLPDLRGKIEEMALDTETRDDSLAAGRGPGWAYRNSKICGVSAAWRAGGSIESFYAPVRHPDTECLDPDVVWDWVRSHQASGIRVTCHNSNYDYGNLGNEGVGVPDLLDDTVAMTVMVDENRTSYTLDDIAAWLGIPGKDERLLREAASAYGFGNDVKGNLWRMPGRYVGPYAAHDAETTLRAAELLRPRLEAEGLVEAYRLEMDLVPLVLEMRRRGVRVNVEAAERARLDLVARRDLALQDLSHHLGHKVGMEEANSPRHLARWFDDAGIVPPRTAPTERFEDGQASFVGDWMEKNPHWLPQRITLIRQLELCASKFLKGFLIDYAHKSRLHANINSFRNEEGGTRSHRFSYSDPPLQQMYSRDSTPLKAELATVVRGCFEPEEGELWGSSDACYDDKTEILTEEGWIPFPELGSQRVAQWDHGAIEWVVPSDYHVGELKTQTMVSVTGTQLDFCVTPNHRCLLYPVNSDLDSPLTIEAGGLKKLFSAGNKIVPQVGLLQGTRKVPAALLKLIVALQADAADRSKYGGNTWVFYVRKERKVARLKEILDELGWDYRVTPPKVTDGSPVPSGSKLDQTGIFVDDDPRLREFLSSGKTFVLPRLLELTPELRWVFLRELAQWDGSALVTGHVEYGNTHKANCDTVQAVAVCTIRRSTLSLGKFGPTTFGKKPFYHVGITGKDRLGTWSTPKLSVKNIEYHGKVYCVTVPSGFVITRRNGKTLVSSNSQQEYRFIVNYAELRKLSKASEAGDRYRNDPNTDYHDMVVDMTGLSRHRAKFANFAKSYGAGVDKFAEMIDATPDEARAIMAQYDRELPFVRELAQDCQRLADRRGFIRLIDGARCHFDLHEPAYRNWDEEKFWAKARPANLDPELAGTAPCSLEVAQRRMKVPGHPWHGRLKRAYTHKAGNRLIQGSAARQIKLAMRLCWREGLVPLLQMHDELCYSLSDPSVGEAVSKFIREAVSLTVPLKTDTEYGTTWGNAKMVKNAQKQVLYGATWDEAVRLRNEGKWWT